MPRSCRPVRPWQIHRKPRNPANGVSACHGSAAVNRALRAFPGEGPAADSATTTRTDRLFRAGSANASTRWRYLLHGPMSGYVRSRTDISRQWEWTTPDVANTSTIRSGVPARILKSSPGPRGLVHPAAGAPPGLQASAGVTFRED
ncbi:hypothetical protein AHiyo1_20620 [Arthrobacter sp. Hiyo1]|nr:hypothetical protein AHiyo1_20620 [Arthrobacter sp. Hiyo1]